VQVLIWVLTPSLGEMTEINAADMVPSFLNAKTFLTFLDDIDPTQNYVDGKFSTLIVSVS